jgi:hypothetical protein
MILSELWHHYEADKRIQGFSPNTLRAYALPLKMLVTDLGDVDISRVTLNLLKEYLVKQSDRLKPSSLGHVSVLFDPYFDLHMKKPICLTILHLNYVSQKWRNEYLSF